MKPSREVEKAGTGFATFSTNSSETHSVSVVIPVYNSEGILPELVHCLGRVLPSLTDHFEAILVNDGSRDHSWTVVRELVDQYPWLSGIDLKRNYGQHNALLAGIREAKYDYIITLDDDLQHPPQEINKLLEKMAEGYDVVYGSSPKMAHSFWRNITSYLTKLALQSAMGVETARQVSAFRAFRRDLREAFADYQGSFISIDVLLTWGTTRFAAVEVRHQPRRLGSSNYTFWKLLTHAINMLTGFSTLPLEIASLIGFIFLFFGFLVLVYVIGRYIVLGGSIPGFPFLASIIALFSGAQLFALGVIGEYLSRMHFRLMNRPPYSVRVKLGRPLVETRARRFPRRRSDRTRVRSVNHRVREG